jgi:hypothetical protein
MSSCKIKTHFSVILHHGYTFQPYVFEALAINKQDFTKF